MSHKSFRLEHVRGLAAQAWCTEKTKHKEMDTDLAEAFAQILLRELYKPNLGCATNLQLLRELSARIEVHWDLDYKTVGEE